MGLESATYIDDLVTTNPDGAADSISAGDDHMRMMKSVMKNTFAGSAGDVYDEAVTVGPDVLNTQEKHNQAGTAAPTASNDTTEGYGVGSLWLDTTNDRAYICLDATTASAVWQAVSPALTCAFLAKRTTAQSSIAADTWVDLNTNSETYDLGGDYDIATDVFTAPAAGLYVFAATINFDNIPDGVQARMRFVCSTAGNFTTQFADAGTTSDLRVHGALVIQLAASETVKVQLQYNGTGTLNTVADADSQWFSGVRIA